MQKRTKCRFGKPIYQSIETRKKLEKKRQEQREQRKKEAKKKQFKIFKQNK